MRFAPLVALASAFTLAFGVSSAAAQTTWYVDINGTPPGSGTQVDPYTSIQYAISRPTTLNGDTVLVALGTYAEHVNFLGKAIHVTSAGGAANTVIDASNVGSAVTFASGEGPASTLTGFTLVHGKGTGVIPSLSGGGVYCSGASPTLLSLVVQNNNAYLGAGMYFASSNAQILLCTVQDNTTPQNCCSYGAGVYVACGGTPVFNSCTIRHNQPGEAQAGGGIFGGGSFHNCTIADNWAFEGGGAKGNTNCPPEFVDCSITGNQTRTDTSDAHIGGGVSGPATLTNCVITGNRGRFNGGGVWNCTLNGCLLANNTVDYVSSTAAHGGGAAASVLVDCDVHDNSAMHSSLSLPSSGGGLSGGTATRCRIWHNAASRGAGVESTALESCTVYANTAADNGGGYTYYGGTGTTIHNSILWGDAPVEIDPTGQQPTVTYSDVMDGFAGTGNIALDPLFWAPLSGDLHLKAGSPCIDTGDPSQMDPDNSRIDMGAYPFDRNYCGPFGTYCMAKVNSQSCYPSIGSTGTPSLSGADNFFVTASQELNQRSGLMIWSTTPAAQPALGGILCVHAFKRTPAQNSGGSALPTIDCSGTYSYFFSHAYMSAQSITVGTTVYAQYYGRDPFIADATGASLSNGIEFTVCP